MAAGSPGTGPGSPGGWGAGRPRPTGPGRRRRRRPGRPTRAGPGAGGRYSSRWRRAGGAVAAPLPRARVHGLVGLDGEAAALVFDVEGAVQDQRVLVELGALAGLGPAGRAAHVGDADAAVASVHPPGELVDDLGWLPARRDPARVVDQFGHLASMPATWSASVAGAARPGPVSRLSTVWCGA